MRLKAQNLTKKYHAENVVDALSFCFEKNHVYGIQGQNGCGKTVLLKLLAGFLVPDAGVVLQDGVPLRKKRNFIADAGIVIESPQFLSHLTVAENLTLLKRMHPRITEKRIHDLLQWYQIEKYANIKYRHCSLGTKQKMSLIQAFIHEPKVLLLDEPFNALDAESVEKTKAYLRDNKSERITILSSHIDTSLEDLCDVRLRMEQGTIEYI